MEVYFVIFLFFTFVFLYPVFYTIMNSLKPTTVEVAEFPMSLPTKWSFKNYAEVFTKFKIVSQNGKSHYFMSMLVNSLWMTGVRIFVNLLSSVLLAYPIAKFKFYGKEFLYGVVIFANSIPLFGTGTTAYKLLMQLGMLNNPFTIWLSWAGGFDFAFIIFYGTFRGISDTYIESANLDGANDFITMFRIMLPQAMPAIVALAITQAIPVWNDYTVSMITMTNFPNLAYGLYTFEAGSMHLGVINTKPIYFAAVIVSMIPPLVLYGSNQKFILSNISAGGLKG